MVWDLLGTPLLSFGLRFKWCAYPLSLSVSVPDTELGCLCSSQNWDQMLDPRDGPYHEALLDGFPNLQLPHG